MFIDLSLGGCYGCSPFGHCTWCHNKHWYVSICLNPISVLLGIFLEVNLLGHREILFSFWGTTKLFPVVAEPLFSPTSNVQVLHFLHIHLLLFSVFQNSHFSRCDAAWQATPVLFLPRKSHGWRSLVGCSPWGHEESDTTERLHFHFSLSCTGEGNGNPLQCSCLENPRHGGAWWAAVCGVVWLAQSQTRLKRLSSSSSSSRLMVLSIFSCSYWLFVYLL